MASAVRRRRACPGEVWTATVQPPLPYRLTFDLLITEVRPLRVVAVDVTGDIEGTARLEVSTSRVGSELHFTSELTPTNSILRTVAQVAAPVARYGHAWVLDSGLRQFRSSSAERYGAWHGGGRDDLVEDRLVGQRRRLDVRELADLLEGLLDERTLDDRRVAGGDGRDVEALRACRRAGRTWRGRAWPATGSPRRTRTSSSRTARTPGRGRRRRAAGRAAAWRTCRPPSRRRWWGRTARGSSASRTPAAAPRAAVRSPMSNDSSCMIQRHRSSGKLKQLVCRSTMAQLHTSLALGQRSITSSRLPLWSTSSCDRNTQCTSSGSTRREHVLEPLLAVRRRAGVDDHRLLAEDHHRVEVDEQRLAQGLLHLVDHVGVLGHARRRDVDGRCDGCEDAHASTGAPVPVGRLSRAFALRRDLEPGEGSRTPGLSHYE